MPHGMCGEVDVFMEAKTVQKGCKVFGKSVQRAIHVNSKVPQEYNVG